MIEKWAIQLAIMMQGWDSIRYFASLCPFEYGENVYLARVVLKMKGDTTEYSNECEVDAMDMPDKSAQYGNDETLTTLVYPNPAKDKINIETEMALPATLTIYSAMGQELFSSEISGSESVIHLSGIQPQPVFYVIRSANGELYRGTLTIIE